LRHHAQCRPYGDADHNFYATGNLYRQFHDYPDAELNTQRYHHSHGYVYCDAHINLNINIDAYCDKHIDLNLNIDAYANTNIDINIDTHANTNIDSLNRCHHRE
jgi:hypothetical protein